MMIFRVAGLFEWLRDPSVLPWVGAAVAAASSLGSEPKRLVRRPLIAARAAVQSGLIWLVLIWLLNRASPGTGDGTGLAGANVDRGGGPGATADPGTTSVKITRGEFPSEIPKQVVLLIRFIPTEDDPAEAREFACNLQCRETGGVGKTIEIRAGGMRDFDRSMEKNLHAVAIPPGADHFEARIKRTPFPGEPALRDVADQVRAVLPGAIVVFED